MTQLRFKEARFCPFCGAESLDRDRYGEQQTPPRYKNEFVCRACGMGIQITPSMKWQTAQSLAKEHRAMRPPDERKASKPKPEDLPLFELQSYAAKLGDCDAITVRRSKSRPSLFVVEFKGLRVNKSTDYQGVKLILTGAGLAHRAETVE